ncbi:recombinase family protein [Paenibacillus senegalensis]|uniref:recombinase family protein n=1 Tax=Paenibacillus senegalensis TaxID=1465766 RepID=UPI000288F9A1|nr:recombinase family protein [Paenibacillus senegalensis]
MRVIQGEKLKTWEISELAGLVRALIYVRVSTEDQARHGYSLESQIERCAAYALSRLACRNEELLAVVEAGERGDNPDRPMMNYVLELLEQGIGQKVILLHPDRLSRYLFLQMELTAKIWDRGGDIEFVEFDLDKENPESMLMFNIQGSIAQYNKAKILANTKRGRRAKARQGQLPGMRRLYGYRFDKSSDQLIVHPDEKLTYLLMVDLLLHKDMSCSAIARELARRGMPGPDGNVWYQATISRILKNEAYTGKYYYGKTETIQLNGKGSVRTRPKEEWIAIPIPAFIDDETYLRILARLSGLKKASSGRPSMRYLLKGLARCGRCSAPVSSGVSSVGKDGKLTYYSCTNKSGKGYAPGGKPAKSRCRGRNWRSDQVDDLVWGKLLSLIDERQLLANWLGSGKAADERRHLELELHTIMQSLEAKTKARRQLLELYLDGILKDKEELRTKLDALEQQIERLRDRRTRLQKELEEHNSSNANLRTHMVNYTSKLHTLLRSGCLSIEDRRALARLFVESVALHENGDIVLHLRISDSTHKKLIRGEGDGGLQESICADTCGVPGRDG